MPTIKARPACRATSDNSLAAEGSWFSISVAARASARGSPLAMSAVLTTMLLGIEDLARDHKPLNFAGAFADGARLDVAVEFFHRIVLEEPVAAVNLHRLIGHANRRL